jgi:hypothetical protein
MRRRLGRVKLRAVTITIAGQSERFVLDKETLPDRKESLRRAARLRGPARALLRKEGRLEPARPIHVDDCDLGAGLPDFEEFTFPEPIPQAGGHIDDFGLHCDSNFSAAGLGGGCFKASDEW